MDHVYKIIGREKVFKNRVMLLLKELAKYYYDCLKDDIDKIIEIS